MVPPCRRHPLATLMLDVLVLDDTRLSLELLVEALRRQPGDLAVTASKDIEAALGLLREHRFELVLLNMAMLDSVAICRHVVDVAPEARVVAFAVSGADEEAVACAEAGVAGYLLRDQSLAELMEVMTSVANGQAACPPPVAAALIRRVGQLAGERPAATEWDRLTPREDEILGLIERGMSNKEIARRLGIEVRTVKNHVHNLLEKLRVRRRGEAAAMLRTRRGAMDRTSR
jgi:two-component system, NarL family, nitrate/nitrite response regulator NarL